MLLLCEKDCGNEEGTVNSKEALDLQVFASFVLSGEDMSGVTGEENRSFPK